METKIKVLMVFCAALCALAPAPAHAMGNMPKQDDPALTRKAVEESYQYYTKAVEAYRSNDKDNVLPRLQGAVSCVIGSDDNLAGLYSQLGEGYKSNSKLDESVKAGIRKALESYGIQLEWWQ